MTTAHGNEVQITLTDGGPALVRGADVVRDDEGRAHPTKRPVVAVCMCGMSRIKPWCDSTHKFVPSGNDQEGSR